MVAEAKDALARERAAEGAITLSAALALSGGSDNGAFGAGLLVGWSETGTRPTFKVVTGISTGALLPRLPSWGRVMTYSCEPCTPL